MMLKTNIAVLSVCALLMGTVRAASGTVRGAGQCDSIIDQVLGEIEKLDDSMVSDGYGASIELSAGHIWDASNPDDMNQFSAYGQFSTRVEKDNDGNRYVSDRSSVTFSDRDHFSVNRADDVTLEITTYPTTITTILHSWGDATGAFTPTHCELLGSRMALIQAVHRTPNRKASYTFTIKPQFRLG